MKNNSHLFYIKVFKSANEIQSFRSSKKRRILHFIQREENQNTRKYFLRVVYGLIKDINNKKVLAKNEGEYFSTQSLIQALNCFTEKGKSDK